MATKKETKEDKQVYLGVGVTFIGAGILFFLNDSMRIMSLVFVILGITFLILSWDEKKTKKR